MSARPAMPQRPYSPETLGDRWACSAEKIRQMVRNGELAGFRLGKLIRIPADEVERIECQNIASSGTEDSGASHSQSQGEAAFESRLERMNEASPRLALVRSGAPGRGPGPKQ